MGDYVTLEDYNRMVQALGPEGAESWARKHDITVLDDAGGALPQEMQMEDEELLAIGDGADDEQTFAAGAPSAGGLGAMDALSAYQKAQQRVTDQIQRNIDLLTAAQTNLRNRRAGPSDAEKWFAIAAALGKPTKTGSFGESLGNLGEVMSAQQAMKRKAEEEREALLEQYGLKIGNEQLRMLQTGATQAGQVYRAAAAANKPKNPYAGAVWSEEQGRWVMRPGSEGGPPVLTPEEVAELRRDPKNLGMQFYTTDGRLLRIK